MKKNIHCLVLLGIWYGVLVPIHPRASAAMTAIQNQLPQLQMRYDPSVVQSVQYYIDLLRQLEPSQADTYQKQLNELLSGRRSAQGQVSSREVPKLPAPPAPSREPIFLPAPPPMYEVAPEMLQPRVPVSVPAQRPLAKPVQPSKLPTDVPPAPTDVSKPPVIIEQLPCAPVACTPDIESKEQLADMQQRAMLVLQKFVPRIKGKSVDEAQKILLQEIRFFVVELSRKNGVIKQQTSEIRTGNQVARHLNAIDFDLTIKAYESLAIALDVCELVYGTESFVQLKDYFQSIRTDFHTMTFGYAQALVDNISRMLADALPSVRSTITSEEEIGYAIGTIIDLATTVHVLAMVDLPRVVLNLESSAPQKKLIANMVDLFTVLQEVLVQTRFAFSDPQVLPLWLKVEQKNFYDLTASVLTTYIDSMPSDALSAQQKKDFYDKRKTTLDIMNNSLLKMRVSLKPSV